MEEIFQCGKPVIGESLVGRKKLIKQLAEILKNGQSIMLAAPRRYGKTSVLLQLLNTLKDEGYFIGDVDIFDTPTKSELAEKIVSSTLKNRNISGDKIIRLAKKGIQNLRKSIDIRHITEDGYEIVLSFAGKPDTNNLLDEALDFPEKFSKKYEKRMVFAYDEFGDLEKMNSELIKKMRARFQKQKNTTYIFSGSQESLMKRLFSDKREAFYGFSRIVYLPKIDESDFIDYIIKTYEREGIKISLPAAKKITEKTDCHPYYTQYVCQIMFLQVKGEKKEIGLEDVEESYKKAIEMHLPYFDDLWQRLMHASLLQLNICRHLAKDGTSPYKVFDDKRQNIYRALGSLKDKGIIRGDKSVYSFVEPLFRDYILLREGFVE